MSLTYKELLIEVIYINVIINDSHRYSHGVSSPGRHVRTRLYFTSESHVHSLLTVLRYGGLLDVSNVLQLEEIISCAIFLFLISAGGERRAVATCDGIRQHGVRIKLHVADRSYVVRGSDQRSKQRGALSCRVAL